MAVSCAPRAHSVPGAEERVRVKAWAEKAAAGLEEAAGPDAAGIAIVDFGNMPAKFGKARWSTGPAGNYSLSYPKEAGLAGDVIDHFALVGSAEPIAALALAPSLVLPMPDGRTSESAQKWSSVNVPGLGRELRFYSTAYAMGDMNDQWECEPFTVIDGKGRAGYYQMSVETMEKKEVAALLSRLRLRR